MINSLKKVVLSNKKLRKKIIRLIRNQQLNTFKIDNFPVYGYYNKKDGQKLSLHKNLRSFVTPNWKNNFIDADEKNSNEPKNFNIDFAVAEYALFFNYFEKTIMSLNFDIRGKKLLEIGAGNALLSYLMADRYKNTSIVSSDIQSYYSDLDKDSDIINARKKVQQSFSNTVPFEDDNISASKFENESFDVIFSNTVLEHIDGIDSAFTEMKRILKPGGFCFHIYNPFFSYNGAHTICSTDHPWGHCVMTESEYEEYTREYYPEYADVSISFFKNDLNKKSLLEFKESIDKSGFSKVTFLPETNFNVMQLLLPNTLKITQEIYPQINLEDLLTNSVIVILQK